ncbi:MAG: hypothetical protein FGM15_01915 [Chthoniobacterales bacterium]|nr:hypothetical protein [Chthoniobacterales bacterium]
MCQRGTSATSDAATSAKYEKMRATAPWASRLFGAGAELSVAMTRIERTRKSVVCARKKRAPRPHILTAPDAALEIFVPMRRAVLLFWPLLFAASVCAEKSVYDASGADGVRYRISRASDAWEIRVTGAGVDGPDQRLFAAAGARGKSGSPLLPPDLSSGAVWLPFPADLVLVSGASQPGGGTVLYRWKQTQWGAAEKADGVSVAREPAQLVMRIPFSLIGGDASFDLSVFLKDMAADAGRGRFYGSLDPADGAGSGERVVRHHLAVESAKSGVRFRTGGRTDPASPKVRIYQLLPRLFGNTNETRKPNGKLEENGTGKFADINAAALDGLKAMGFTHLWLTGVMQQATATDYTAIGEPADDADLLKGLAGSPYAVKDWFDVCPDYAVDPAKRLEEFKALVGRAHDRGLKVLVDFVPNHVARSYASTVKPELSFGAKDDRGKFFSPGNNFYYLTADSHAEGPGAPLRLPTVDGDGRATSPTVLAAGGGDGLFDGEKDHGRVTGNNVVSWSPGPDTWYETAKLNYGYNFRAAEKDARAYPHGSRPDIAVPDTWEKMDAVVAYWQGLGVDGFRADMAHMVPPEFWSWLISRARERNPQVYFVAEAYNDDEAKVASGDSQAAKATGGNVLLELLKSGFDAVYDDPSYDTLKNVYLGKATANDLDSAARRPFLFDNSLRYAENHDEVRLASPSQWGGLGPRVGMPVSALLFGMSRGPVMVYHGQEVGEQAADSEGFGKDDARTTIYDYWSMPEFTKWVNGGKFDGGKLSAEQHSLRDFYRRLLAAVDAPAFRDGGFYPLNPDNLDNPGFGRVDGGKSGEWLYAYLRHDSASGQRMLVVVNLNPGKALRDVRIRFPKTAMRFLGWDALAGSEKAGVVAQDRLGEVPGETAELVSTPAEMENPGLLIKELQPLTAAYYELSAPAASH